MNKIFYISDLHFFHENIIKICNRPFSSVEEMNNTLINNWNKKVEKDDTVYILGDLAFKSPDLLELINIIQSLNGHKILIKGNHDYTWLKPLNNQHPKIFTELFDGIYQYLEIVDNKRQVVLFHYPIEDFNHQYHGGYHLFGHIHNSDKEYRIIDRRYNVGVEVIDYEPKTLDELIELNKKI